MRIGLSLEGSDAVGVDCGGALQSIRGGIMKRQLKLAGLAVLLSVAAHPVVAQEKLKIGIIVTLYFWWYNTKGLHESSTKALRIMQITTVMVVTFLVWCIVTLLTRGPAQMPPPPTPASAFLRSGRP